MAWNLVYEENPEVTFSTNYSSWDPSYLISSIIEQYGFLFVGRDNTFHKWYVAFPPVTDIAYVDFTDSDGLCHMYRSNGVEYGAIFSAFSYFNNATGVLDNVGRGYPSETGSGIFFQESTVYIVAYRNNGIRHNGVPFEPVVYNYIPVAYCRSPYSHRNFAMIKSAYTEHGKPQTTVSQDHFVRVGDVDVPQPGDNLTKLVEGLQISGEKMIAWAGPNGLGIKRNADVDGDKSYTLKYYFSGVHDGTLDHTIIVSGLQRYFLSYLYDVTLNVMRPSIIKYDPATPLTIWSYNNETVTDAQQLRYRQWFGLNYGITIPDSPGYWNDEASPVDPESGDPGSGQGVEDKTTAGIQPPATLPGVNALDTNFVTIWSPSLAEMKNLSNYMWNTLDLTHWRKLFADPMDCILACYMYPLTNLQVRGTPTPSTADVNVGNISTGIEMHLVEDQFVSLSYGTLHIDRQTNSYMDFAPYTKCSLYLPYIGIVAVDVDEIMGKDINLTYNIDLMTGTCLAMLTCETTDGSDVLYQWAGNCAIPIPMTSASFDTVIKNSLSVLGTTAAAVCGMASGGTAAVMGGIGAAQSLANVSNSKPDVGRSGALGSNASFLGPQDAYLIWQYPNEWRADKQNAIEGYPLYATETLSSLEGFTKVLDMHLEGMSCTQTEADEIMQLLKEGVII